MSKVSWRILIESEMQLRGESMADVEAKTLTDEQLDVFFDNGYGGTEGCEFTLWTKNRVYFPVCYDGSEWVDSAPRHPCDEATYHVGGG